MYFNYHAKIKKLILKGDAINYKIVDNWNGIKPALVIFFVSHRPMPIRKEKWNEYFALLKHFSQE